MDDVTRAIKETIARQVKDPTERQELLTRLLADALNDDPPEPRVYKQSEIKDRDFYRKHREDILRAQFEGRIEHE